MTELIDRPRHVTIEDEPSRPGDVAIIGMAGRFPGASDLGSLWEMLCEGRTGIRDLEPMRGRPDGWVFRDASLTDAADLDAGFFGLSDRDALLMDPQQRVFLDVVWRALEDAAHDGDVGRSDVRIGVFAATSASTYLFGPLRDAGLWDPGTVDYPAIIGNDKDFLATRVSYQLGLSGPALVTQTACSSSLTAIHVARLALQRGDCDLAVVGGVSVDSTPGGGYRYRSGGIMSPDGHCRPFDAAARGTIRGDGAAAVVLRPLADAMTDRDRVIAVVCGSAINNDGNVKVGFTAPGIQGQKEVIQAALVDAGIAAHRVGYVETHGTGTAIGDPIELTALAQAHRDQGGPPTGCFLGSVKANLGHLDAAAGITGLVKAALVISHQVVPPQAEFSEPNQHLTRLSSHYTVSRSMQASSITHAAVSSFGMGGSNAHVILQKHQAAPRPADLDVERTFVVSARDEDALRQRLRDLAAFASVGRLRGDDVSFTLSRCSRRYELSVPIRCRLSELSQKCADLAQDHRLIDRAEPETVVEPCGEDLAARRIAIPGHPQRTRRYWPEACVPPAENGSGAVSRTHPGEPAHVEDVLTIARRVLRNPELSLDDDLFSMGADSMDLVQLLAEIEDLRGERHELEVLTTRPRLRSLLPEGPAEVPSTAEDSGTGSSMWHLVRSGDENQLVLLHPAGGTTACYQPLALKGTDGWTWHAIGLRATAWTPTSLRALASRYAELISDRSSDAGRLVVGGYSMGGNLAVEVALQLQERGRHIDHLLLIDSYPPETYIRPRNQGRILDAFAVLAPSLFPELTGAVPPDACSSVSGLVAEMRQQLGLKPASARLLADVEMFFRMWSDNHAALERWYPQDLVRTPTTIVSATGGTHPVMGVLDILPLPPHTWNRHLRDPATVVQTTGDHFSLVQDPVHVSRLAAVLDRVLSGIASLDGAV